MPWVVQVAIVLSTLGAALQSLTGAPRLLAAIANDDIIPVLKYFKAPDDEEPYYATVFTMFICASCVVLGNLDLISPVTTMFFLLCYGGVNLSCFLLDLLDAPSWRPRFKFHHWSLSLLGALLCISKLCAVFIFCDSVFFMVLSALFVSAECVMALSCSLHLLDFEKLLWDFLFLNGLLVFLTLCQQSPKLGH